MLIELKKLKNNQNNTKMKRTKVKVFAPWTQSILRSDNC